MDATLAHFGATTAIIPNAEFYTSMERGVVDGFVEPLTASIPRQMAEVTKYIIDPGFLRGGVVVIMSLDAWNGLPPHLQKVLMDAAAEARKEFEVGILGAINKMREIGKAGGMETITWAPADAERFKTNLYEIGWADFAENHPDVAAKLKPMLTK
jgi:TRAP-type C4-dicarboxylate transport system substrate-binding protein